MSDTETASGDSFRVRVSLERFFGDERARCYVLVRGARRVRWLARRLRRLFPLPRRLSLLSRGHLLPPDEPLALLQPDDPVEVIQASVEFDKIDSVKELATNDLIEVSTPEPMETSPDCKRRRKTQQLHHNDSEHPVDTTITLPVVIDNDTHKWASKKPSQQPDVSVEPLTENKRRQNNKQLFFYDSDSTHPVTTDTNGTAPTAIGNIVHKQEIVKVLQEPELSDRDRIRVLKEQALSVLDQVAARPRRRVRVRRRRKRPDQMQDEFSSNMADSTPVPYSESNATLDPGPVSAPDYLIETISETPRKDDYSFGEDTPNASNPVSISTPETKVEASRHDSEPTPLLDRASLADAVLQNMSTTPRPARLVHSLGNVANDYVP